MTVARGRNGTSGPATGPSAPVPPAPVPPAPVPPAPVPPATVPVRKQLSSAGPVTARVLLVEDEPGLLRALFINLRARHYDVITASTGREALATAANRPPDAVILDLGLPDIDGTEVIVELRRWSRAPIIVLSGRASPGDKIGALDVGADDYVTKPFSMAELLARLRAVLRRDDPGPAVVTEAAVGHCVIDLVAHTVTRRGQGTPLAAGTPAAGMTTAGMTTGEPAAAGTAADDAGETAAAEEVVRLTPTEWRILESLVHHPGQLVSSRQLLTEIWGPGHEPRTNYLRFHMAKLRRKLEDDPARPRHLLTEPGMGYRYRP
jgi:two-component system, OmpR family, KDP operon response regulator KdpE